MYEQVTNMLSVQNMFQILPMHDVGKQVIMFESVVWIDSLIIDGEGTSSNTPLVLSRGVSPELPGEHVEDPLAYPSSFGESCEREVVRIYFPETCNNVGVLLD